MFLAIGSVIAGLVLLAGAGEAFVRSAITVASRLSISPMVIGLTIVAFGTSLPELMVSLQAVTSGQSDIAVGNVVGSNIANVLLVLGAAAVISPFICDLQTIRRDGAFMIGATLFLVGVSFIGDVPRFFGIGMLLILGIIVVVQVRSGDEPEVEDVEHVLPGGLLLNVPLMIIALGGVVWGADLLILGAIDIATFIGVSEAVIGLTVVAVGTSLPELVVSIIAALRGHAAVAVGNVIGSNIFNILLILGAAAAIGPLSISAEIAGRDIWVMLVSSSVMLYFLRSGAFLSRREGLVALGLYLSYNLYLFNTIS